MKFWKAIAIILLVILVVENIALYNLIKVGYEDIDKEWECSINVCQPYESYVYIDGVCTCYNGLEAQHTEYIS